MPAVTDWRMSHHEDFLQQGQITPGDVVGAYGFNTLAACPSLGGQYFPLNMAPCLALSSSLSDMGYGCGTPLWYNPGSCFCGTMAGPCGCCEGPAIVFAKGDANFGSPSHDLRSQFEQALKGEGMARELMNAESESDLKKRFLVHCCRPPLYKQAVHLNNTWAKDVNERLLMPAGYFCVLRNWETSNYLGGARGQEAESSFLQLLIVKGDEDAMKRMIAAAQTDGAPTTTTMERGSR